jgi:hypothetical protein
VAWRPGARARRGDGHDVTSSGCSSCGFAPARTGTRAGGERTKQEQDHHPSQDTDVALSSTPCQEHPKQSDAAQAGQQ